MSVTALRDPPAAWNDRLVLEYPNGRSASFHPRGRFVRAGAVVNGFVVDHLRLEGEDVVVAVLRPRAV